MNTKHIILMACAALLGATQANAQGQDLSILTANTDARTAAMGNASAAAEGMYLYNNPAAIFATDKKFTADVSASLFEKAEGTDGTFGIYALSAGYKLAKRHAVFAGFRYAGGLSLKGSDLLGNPTKDYKPYNWTLDLGYTYSLVRDSLPMQQEVLSIATSQRMLQVLLSAWVEPIKTTS